MKVTIEYTIAVDVILDTDTGVVEHVVASTASIPDLARNHDTPDGLSIVNWGEGDEGEVLDPMVRRRTLEIVETHFRSDAGVQLAWQWDTDYIAEEDGRRVGRSA